MVFGDQVDAISAINDQPLAHDELIQSVYLELKRVARGFLRRERSDHTLQPTALVHEAYLRLSEQDRTVWQSREHFIGIAATMMRRILVDHARRKKSNKGGHQLTIPFDEINAVGKMPNLDLLALDEAMQRLAEKHPQESRIVELKFFGGLSISETAEILDVSDTTVERGWRFAHAWLFRELT